MLVSITGSDGFLGVRTVAAAQRAGHEVRALVRTTDSARAALPSVSDPCVGDQNDPAVVARLVAGTGAVIHIAMDWTALNEGPIPNAERNLLASLRLLEQARAAGVRQFIFVSSMDVYNTILDDRPADENHPAWPGSIYGAFKAAIEVHLKAYHAAYAMNTSAWRPATMYGINSRIERSLWFDTIRQVKRGGTLPPVGGADVVNVQDVADALALAVGDERVAGEIYNVVEQRVNLDLVVRLARTPGGSSATIDETPPIARRHDTRQRFDNAKAIAFFNRHGNTLALRRGVGGITDYVRQLRELS